jgi:hypothetical protein
MFELTRIARDPGFAARIFPIVMADAGIFDAVERVGHLKYWEHKRDELDEVMRSVGQENLHGIREELDNSTCTRPSATPSRGSWMCWVI